MKLLVSALLLAVCLGLDAQAVWHVSDALGTVGQVAPQNDGRGWVLRVERAEASETRTLFHDGVEDSVRVLDLDSAGRVTRWRDLRDGEVVWEVTLDPVSGLPQTETVFQENHPREVSTLEFRDRVLFRRSVRSADDTLLYEDRLLYWPDGSLRRLERDGPEGPLAETSWTYGPDGRLVAAWSVDEDDRAKKQHQEWVFAPGRTEEILASETAILVSRVTEALEVGGTRETRVDTSADRREVRLTDSHGRILEETITRKGVLLQTRRWAYDPQGRVLESTVESAGPRETWAYRYEGDLVLATLTRDGQVVQEESSRDGEKLSVRLYDRGDLFLEETWTGGRKVKEVYLDHGTILRERSF